MYGYIYKTTNVIDEKTYVGQHKSEKFEPNEYIGSGSVLFKAIQKYGKENFICELIEWCETKKITNEREIFWIAQLKPEYNLTKRGDGGLGGSPKGRKFSEIGRKHMSNAKKGAGNTMYGKHHSEETKRKISLANKGRKFSEETRKRISEGHKGIPNKWKGHRHIEEAKQKIRNALLGRKHTAEELAKMRRKRHENTSL